MMCHHNVVLPITANERAKHSMAPSIVALFVFMLLGSMLCIKLEVANGTTNRSKELVEVEEYGLPGPNAKTHDEKCVFARRAAEINARRALAETIKSQVEAVSQSENLGFSEEKTKIFVNQTLRGSKITQVEEYDGCNRVKVKIQTEIDFEKISQGNKINEAEVNQLTELMVRGCSLGQKVSFEVEADGGIAFLKKGLKGHFKSDRSEIPSIINFIATDKDSTKVVQVANDTRKCMERYMDMIFDNILGKGKS